MDSEKFATIQNGKIALLVDGTNKQELNDDQIPLTTNEYYLLKAVRGDLELAELIVKDLKERIAKLG